MHFLFHLIKRRGVIHVTQYNNPFRTLIPQQLYLRIHPLTACFQITFTVHVDYITYLLNVFQL